jgi:hypothetical protein
MRWQIQPLDPPDWSIPPDAFAAALVERWPEAQVSRLTDALFAALHCRIDIVPWEALELRYPRSGDALWIEGGRPRDVGALGQWYLELVPPGTRMFLAEECASSVTVLTAGMGAAEIARAFEAPAAIPPPWAA